MPGLLQLVLVILSGRVVIPFQDEASEAQTVLPGVLAPPPLVGLVRLGWESQQGPVRRKWFRACLESGGQGRFL